MMEMQSVSGGNMNPAGAGINGAGGKPIFIGPAAAAIGKINDVYRMAVYVKMDDYDGLIAYKDMLEKYIKDQEAAGGLRNINVQFDFDPVNGF
jgi:primosomal protein N' (replication factor Y)